jgi:GTPase SAR1 family protein
MKQTVSLPKFIDQTRAVLFGISDVGKSCLLERYLRGRFKDNVSMV